MVFLFILSSASSGAGAHKVVEKLISETPLARSLSGGPGTALF